MLLPMSSFKNLLKGCLLFALQAPAVVVFSQSNADSMLHFIANNRSRASLYVIKNDTLIAKLNETELMPLASTVKLMIAVEFAKQVGSQIINEDSLIALSELDKYYLPNTDGGAHSAWLAYEKTIGHDKTDSAKLIDIAKGMMMFSSNANAEYLLDLVGMDNVKSNVQLFGLNNHTAIFPIVSSLMLYQNPRKLKEKDIINGIKALPEEAYCKTIFQIHNALKYDTTLKKKFKLNDLTPKMQQLWSERLTASTTKDYVQLCSILNKRRYLNADSYGIIAEVVESIMEDKDNQKVYKQFGLKNGSTAFVLTEAFYATMQTGEMIEAAYFFNNLTVAENLLLQGWLNDFRIAITQNEAYRQRLMIALKK
jgi:D-alanyl-D-alanine carboxypeptidase